MIAPSIFGPILVGLLIAFQIVSRFTKGYRFWGYTDYIWYGLAVGSLLIFISDANSSANARAIQDIKIELRQTADNMIRQVERAADGDVKNPLRLYSERVILAEARKSTEFPLNRLRDAFGKEYETVFEYLQSITDPNSFANSGVKRGFLFDRNIQRAAELQAELKTRLNTHFDVKPVWLHLAAYLLAIGVAIRLGKVTAKL